jgi:hypothetical protein
MSFLPSWQPLFGTFAVMTSSWPRAFAVMPAAAD